MVYFLLFCIWKQWKTILNYCKKCEQKNIFPLKIRKHAQPKYVKNVRLAISWIFASDRKQFFLTDRLDFYHSPKPQGLEPWSWCASTQEVNLGKKTQPCSSSRDQYTQTDTKHTCKLLHLLQWSFWHSDEQFKKWTPNGCTSLRFSLLSYWVTNILFRSSDILLQGSFLYKWTFFKLKATLLVEKGPLSTGHTHKGFILQS